MDITHYDTENRPTDKNLLYSTRNSLPHTLQMAYMGKESKTNQRWTHIKLIYFALYLKLTQHGTSTIFNNFFLITTKYSMRAIKETKEERSEFLPAQEENNRSFF